MERGDCHGFDNLNLEIFRLNVHVRCLRSAAANAIEDLLEELFEFLATVGAIRKLTG